jgi:hypothetical protein
MKKFINQQEEWRRNADSINLMIQEVDFYFVNQGQGMLFLGMHCINISAR